MTIESHKYLPKTIVLVDDASPETISAGTTWKSDIFDLTASMRGAYSLDFKLTTAGSPTITMTVRGGNYTDGIARDLPDLGVASADLPTLPSAPGSSAVIWNIENQNTNFGQIWLAVATADVTIDYAVLRVW